MGYRMIYNEKGFLEKKLFLEYAGSHCTAPDQFGTYGREYEYTEDGRLYRIYYLGADGERKAKENGTLYLEYTYSENGRIIEEIYYNSDGKKIEDHENIAEIRVSYTENSVTYCYYNKEGKRVEVSEIGASQYTAVFKREI